MISWKTNEETWLQLKESNNMKYQPLYTWNYIFLNNNEMMKTFGITKVLKECYKDQHLLMQQVQLITSLTPTNTSKEENKTPEGLL